CGALVVKPHVALLEPCWLAAGGRWRAFAAAAGSALGLLAASWLAFGGATMIGYTSSWEASAAIMRFGDADFFLRMATPYSQIRIHGGETLAAGVAAVLALAMIALVMRGWRRFGQDGLASGALMLAAT